MKSRKINGKHFFFMYNRPTKSATSRLASGYRKFGYRVRIFKTKQGYDMYAAYDRLSKRDLKVRRKK